jgi:hypothetical protein
MERYRGSGARNKSPWPRFPHDRRIQTGPDLLSSRRATSFQPGAREFVMAKGQMRSNKEKKKPKADKNIKKGGAAPSPFSSGKTPAGEAPHLRKG